MINTINNITLQNRLFLQVCEGQMHFARRFEGPKMPLPYFRGIKGPEIVRSLLEIEATFEKNLQILKDVRKTILDVKVRNTVMLFTG